MEVTSVSPSATSPTEGDDLCEIDGSNVAIHSVILLISLYGLAGNGAVLWLLSLKFRTTRIFILAFADFFFLLFTVPSAVLFLVEDLSCSPLLPPLYVSFLFQLSLFCYYWALLWLFRTSLWDSMGKLCALCCHWKPPERLQWVVYSVQYWAFFAFFTVIPTVTSLCPSHHQKHCWAALISMYTLIQLLIVVPGAISHAMDCIKAERGSREQQHKRRNFIISLVVFLIFLLSLINFLQQFGYIFVSSKVVFLLNCIHSSIKPFICFLAGRCWKPGSIGSLRLALQRIFDETEEKTAQSSDAPNDMGV